MCCRKLVSKAWLSQSNITRRTVSMSDSHQHRGHLRSTTSPQHYRRRSCTWLRLYR